MVTKNMKQVNINDQEHSVLYELLFGKIEGLICKTNTSIN